MFRNSGAHFFSVGCRGRVSGIPALRRLAPSHRPRPIARRRVCVDGLAAWGVSAWKLTVSLICSIIKIHIRACNKCRAVPTRNRRTRAVRKPARRQPSYSTLGGPARRAHLAQWPSRCTRRSPAREGPTPPPRKRRWKAADRRRQRGRLAPSDGSGRAREIPPQSTHAQAACNNDAHDTTQRRARAKPSARLGSAACRSGRGAHFCIT